MLYDDLQKELALFKKIEQHRGLHPEEKYFKEKLNIPFAYQVIKEENIDMMKDDIRIISADKFLSSLA